MIRQIPTRLLEIRPKHHMSRVSIDKRESKDIARCARRSPAPACACQCAALEDVVVACVGVDADAGIDGEGLVDCVGLRVLVAAGGGVATDVGTDCYWIGSDLNNVLVGVEARENDE